MMKPRLLDQVRDAIRRPIMAPTGWRFPSTGTFGDQYPYSASGRSHRAHSCLGLTPQALQATKEALDLSDGETDGV